MVLPPRRTGRILAPFLCTRDHFTLEAYSEWYGCIVDFLAHGRFPKDRHKARDVRRVATQHVLEDGILFRRVLDSNLLRCLTKEESREAMREAHQGSCGGHQGGRRLHELLLRIGYYWPSMFQYCVNFARSCRTCQLHVPLKHLRLEPLHSVSAHWPFQMQGAGLHWPYESSAFKEAQVYSNGYRVFYQVG